MNCIHREQLKLEECNRKQSLTICFWGKIKTLISTCPRERIKTIVIKDNYRFAGFLTIFSYGIAAIIAFWLVEVKDNHNEKAKEGAEKFFELLKQILKNKYLILFLVGVALLNETHQTITVFLNQLQYVKCGLSDAVPNPVLAGGQAVCYNRPQTTG